MGRFDDGWRVLGVRTGIKVSFAIGANRSDERHMRREIHEVAREEFDVSVDRTELDLARIERAGNRAALRAGVRKI